MEQSEAGAKSRDIEYVMENNGRRGKWRGETDDLFKRRSRIWFDQVSVMIPYDPDAAGFSAIRNHYLMELGLVKDA